MATEEAPTAPQINAETVDALVDAVRDLVAAEDGREQSFNIRAGGLAGFVGIIVSISTVGGKVALDQNPTYLATVLGAIAFSVAMVALIGSLVVAITKILIPRESAAIGMGTIERYPTWEYISKVKPMVQGEILHGLIAALAKDRQRNSSKAKALRRSYVALLIGVAALAAFAVILTVDAIW